MVRAILSATGIAKSMPGRMPLILKKNTLNNPQKPYNFVGSPGKKTILALKIKGLEQATIL